MSNARSAIFQAIERAHGTEETSADQIAEDARNLITDPATARPAITADDPIDAFIERATGPKVGASVDRIDDLNALPAKIAKWLDESGRPLQVALQPTADLTGLDWTGAGITLTNDVDDKVAVGLARFCIAETGSLVFHSAADMPILLNFLPAVHIVAIRASTILSHLEDYADAARAAGNPTPRNACLITGASGTTDIEGRLVKGAHGPGELKIVVVDDR
ncbi:MAG: LUD domain-containing protein [Pseudomonadota bacterium]